MSDEEVQEVAVEEVAAEEVAEEEEEEEESMTFEEAIIKVLKTSLIHDGLARGLKECVKALDRKEAHLCILAESCDEQQYIKLIKALCEEYGVRLLNVEDSKQLGEWVGLCKLDAEKKARKVVGCSCVVIKSWGEETRARALLLEALEGME